MYTEMIAEACMDFMETFMDFMETTFPKKKSKGAHSEGHATT